MEFTKFLMVQISINQTRYFFFYSYYCSYNNTIICCTDDINLDEWKTILLHYSSQAKESILEKLPIQTNYSRVAGPTFVAEEWMLKKVPPGVQS